MSAQYPSHLEQEHDSADLHRESGYGTMPDLTIKNDIQNPSLSYKEASIDNEDSENEDDDEFFKDEKSDERRDSVSSLTAPLRKWRPIAEDLHLISLATEEFDNKVSVSDDLELDDNFGKLSEFVGKSHSNSSNGTSTDSKIETPKPVRISWFSSSELLSKPFFQKLKDTVTGKQTFRSSIKAPKPGKTFIKRYISDRKRVDNSLNIPTFTDRERFNMQFEVLDQIGSGGNSVVRLAFDKIRNHQVVCKFIQSANIWHWSSDKVPLEIETMRKLKHCNTMTLYDYFSLDDGKEWILVLEYLGKDWVDLYDYIETFGPVNEEDTKIIFSQVLDALEFMHKLGYSHNDIKDENIMINTESKKIKLIDFGSCMPLQLEPVNVFYGTQKFSSPEALETKSYRLEDQEVWALGTLLYVLLFKMDPFINDEEILNLDIQKRIRKLRMGSSGISPIPISDNAHDLIVALMQKDPINRPHLLAIRQFDFFRCKSGYN